MALPADASGPAIRLLPMARWHLDAVHAIERASQSHPWSRGMFADCLRVGYSAWVLAAGEQRLLGFALSSLAMDDAHLLNLAVAPAARRQGHARRLTEHVIDQARSANARRLLLEVRASNAAALSLYTGLGFAMLARRKNYYPAEGGREDALILQRRLR